MTTRKFTALDGIRGFAAIFVMMRHSSQMWGFKLAHGMLAVDVFFLLSGFVIASSYEHKLASGELTLGGFVRTRLIRFYPMYLVALALCAIAAWQSGMLAEARVSHARVLELAALGTFFIPLPGLDVFPLLSVSWSLFYELVVNIVYAVARPLLSTRVLLAVSAVSFAIVGAAARHNGSVDLGWAGTLPGVVSGLARSSLGICLGIVLFRHRQAVWAWLPRVPSGVAIAAICVILCAPAIGPEWVFDVIAIALFPLLMMAAARAEPPLPRAMTFLGSASYPIYLLHGPAHRAIESGFHVAAAAPLSGIAFVTAMVLVGVGAERFYDLPVRRWLTAAFGARVLRLKTS